MHRWGIGLILALTASTADARPFYLKVYKETFPLETRQKLTCNICHAGDRKSIRNDYGKQVEAKLSGKNIQDADEIRRILQELGPHPRRPMK